MKTKTSPLFRKSAEELAHRLATDTSPEAKAMATEALALVDVFESWETQRPVDEERLARIHQLFDLNRRVMDYVSRSPGDASPPPSRRYTR